MQEQDQHLLFGPRFLESYAGNSLLGNPKIAIVELIANSWDAGATRVDIDWPDEESGRCFSILDNGSGMTDEEFTTRWRTLAYSRPDVQGDTADFPPGVNLPERLAYGRNGRGRFAGFCFGSNYFVETWKNGQQCAYNVMRGVEQPIAISPIGPTETRPHGTRVYVTIPRSVSMSAEEARSEIGMRFLTDPNFKVYLDGDVVNFRDIPPESYREVSFEVEGVGEIIMRVIDTQEADKTTYQHGVAWQVRGKQVGDCSWRVVGEHLIDGRRVEAKRSLVIVQADCLEDAVNPDWSSFDPTHEGFLKAKEVVVSKIRELILHISEEKRRETFREITQQNAVVLREMGTSSRDKWKTFVCQVQEECPSINERDLSQVSAVLAKLEASNQKYALLGELGSLEPEQLDDLHRVLVTWTIDMAKVVLDELEGRMRLVRELGEKVKDVTADELHEIHPLFEKGLWIFGPEYESIEYTSNEGMTRVIQELFRVDTTGSRNRPDFVVLPDGSVGFYNYYDYDDDGNETGPKKVTIVELKRSGIPIGYEEKSQCWKYIKELIAKGIIGSQVPVDGFVLGSSIEPTEKDILRPSGNVKICPIDYDTIMRRAYSRLLHLYERVKSAPFLDGQLTNFVDEACDAREGEQHSLLE